ncbi:Two-component response regulator, SAPR family, consists of REC, wHTH and BTAD domains [Sporobacter termitidis DSM 10068]|uniref:Stage 0 sporulation protein A homolog n=1 Tax=Sporobacter termitidis DSM 10068 TaxID=1123282 RepID=A0A1M5UR32_9FIRM|nr:response regulator [Sporobacter termitidis]SHH65370.1 Two-component response regulator, SAPR family, consists of REC, wHTH and BTAD domains [Sporobacter termitidis DSM 10068]
MKAIVVDDEELARSRLSSLLDKLDDIELCGCFGTAGEALRYLEANDTDVVYLDISMPEMDGMAFANVLLEKGNPARVVFVTGYDAYAVQAFELAAADYLLKPVSRERLEKTVQRLRRLGPSRPFGQKMKVACFGGFSAVVVGDGSSVVNWRSPKTEELFAFLILNKKVSRDDVVNALWDGLAPEKALKNINSTIYYIRKALSPYGLEQCVVTTRKEIRINPELIACDMYEFETLLDGRADHGNQISMLERLAELYRGELFCGKAYEWSFSKAHSLESRYIGALLEGMECYTAERGYEKAEQICKRALEIDPLNEEVCGRLIEIYLKTERENQALRAYNQLEKLLMEELGEKPQYKIRRLLGK